MANPTVIPTFNPWKLCPPGKHHDGGHPEICLDCSGTTYNHGGMHYAREWCYAIPPNQNEFKYLDKINVQCGIGYIGAPLYHNGEYEFGCVDDPKYGYPTDTPSGIPSFIPSGAPSFIPSDTPSFIPSNTPSFIPSNTPSFIPSNTPSLIPSDPPSAASHANPTLSPTSIDPIAATDGRAWMFSTCSLGAIIFLYGVNKLWKKIRAVRRRAWVKSHTEINMVTIPTTTGLPSQDSLRETYSQET